MMRILITIPHYFRPGEQAPDGRRYASWAADPQPRLHALTACLTALHQLFNAPPCFIHHGRGTAHQAAPARHRLDVVLCTTRGAHQLDSLPVASRYYTHVAIDAEPLLLGFACHAVLRDRLGQYDYYGYLEDDLVLHDPWFFVKLAWFNRHASDGVLLQPNRFEAGLNHLVPKVYVDGDLHPDVTADFQDVRDSGPLHAEVLGVPVVFQRTWNPHAGCFFLNARQMAHWAGQPHFNDHAARFIGPLESAATLGILRTFRIYRAAPPYADFLEVQHFGAGYLNRLQASPASAEVQA
jgi:hypothetical protein